MGKGVTCPPSPNAWDTLHKIFGKEFPHSNLVNSHAVWSLDSRLARWEQLMCQFLQDLIDVGIEGIPPQSV